MTVTTTYLHSFRSHSISTPLSKLLVSSRCVAHALDWNKDRNCNSHLLSVCITREQIRVWMSSHPLILRRRNEEEEEEEENKEEEYDSSFLSSSAGISSSSSASSRELPAIRLTTETVVGKNQCRIHPQTLDAVSKLIHGEGVQRSNNNNINNICVGLVVHWPLQREGWCGAACGRVLFTLDQLAAHQALGGRPLCLWHSHSTRHNNYKDDNHGNYHRPQPSLVEDSWGRSHAYARPTITRGQVEHWASKEQYYGMNHLRSPIAIRDVWNDFCRFHWPECSIRNRMSQSKSSTSSSSSTHDRMSSSTKRLAATTAAVAARTVTIASAVPGSSRHVVAAEGIITSPFTTPTSSTTSSSSSYLSSSVNRTTIQPSKSDDKKSWLVTRVDRTPAHFTPKSASAGA